jgi:hypothetical protein
MVLTNSTPFPIQTNRWYVGVFNSAATNVPFMAQACYATNLPVIIPLTNDVPFVADFASPFVAPPGPPRQFFFSFTITNSTRAVLFELYNLSGSADLVLQRDVPPGMAPYFAVSEKTGSNTEQIVLRTRFDLQDLRGTWYLGVNNKDSTNVAYTIRAELQNNALLISALPLQVGISFLSPNRGLLLNWYSVVGERYFVQFSPDLNPPINWVTVQTNVATTTTTTYLTPPIPTIGSGFWRVIQAVSVPPSSPPLNIQVWTNGLLRISWPTLYPGYRLQYEIGLFSNVWFDDTYPVTIEGTEFVVYEPIVNPPRYYRLVP